ncbi:hypothetical protein Tco_0272184 [Tanacetum coccineum]
MLDPQALLPLENSEQPSNSFEFSSILKLLGSGVITIEKFNSFGSDCLMQAVPWFSNPLMPIVNWEFTLCFVSRDNLQRALKNKGIIDSGCSRHMTRNKAYLAEYQDYNGALNIIPSGGLACLIAKATVDESNKCKGVDKYVAEILKKFDFASVKTASTLIETHKPLVKDEEAADGNPQLEVVNCLAGDLFHAVHEGNNHSYFYYKQIKNPVYHSRTKHIEIRHHFIRDCYEKRLIDVIKIHIDANVADLLTKGFDVTRFKFLVMDDKRYVMLFGLRIKGLVCAAQKYFTMEMMFGLGNKMLFGLANLMLLGKFGAVREIWCCQANLVLPGKISMENLEFFDQHNMVACLEKTEGNSDFHEIVDFLASSSIHHALTVSPTIYTSYIEQFWNTASSQTVNDVKQINATVDSKAVVVTEASIRSSLIFNDADGTACLTNEAIFQNLALMGYEGDFNKLTFQKALFSPQWKFLIHTILHCLSSKSTSWNEFSTNIASAVICLATNQKFNFSKLIFDGMLRNLDNTKKKFLMYPRRPTLEPSFGHATSQDSRDSLEGTNGNEGDQV